MSAKLLDYVVRVAGVGALALGLAIWSGAASSLLPFHVAMGAIVSTGLFVLAVIAAVRGATRALSAVSILWALGTVALGVGQTTIFQGDQHTLVRIAHLLVGVVVVALAAAVTRSLTRSRKAMDALSRGA